MGPGGYGKRQAPPSIAMCAASMAQPSPSAWPERRARHFWLRAQQSRCTAASASAQKGVEGHDLSDLAWLDHADQRRRLRAAAALRDLPRDLRAPDTGLSRNRIAS